jgi:hypothetical protein
MAKNRYLLKSIADIVTASAKKTIDDLRDGCVEQEAPFTDRLITNIQNQLDGKTIKGIHWRAKTLTDRGKESQESIFGADFLGVLTLELQDLHITKGFFAQAKLIRRTKKLTKLSEFKRLQEQCQKMLKITPDSFVFIYSKRGIKIIPALSILGTTLENINSLSKRTIGRFFREYVECFIGDSKFRDFSLDNFYKMAEEYKVRQGIYIHASDESGYSEQQMESIK